MRFRVGLAALILVLSGCGGDKGGGEVATSTTPADSTDRMHLVLAVVGDLEITAEDLRNHMIVRSGPDRVDEMMRHPDILQVGLSAVMDQFVWAEMARREGVELTQAEKHRILGLESELLSTRYVAKVIQDKSTPSDEDIEAYYNEHQEQYLTQARVGARHIQVATRAEALRIKEQVDQGADFADLARRFSKDQSTNDLGGALGYVEASKPVLGMGTAPEFVNAILDLDQGESAVVQTVRGWHVIYAEKREGAQLKPLSEVYESIVERLTPSIFGRVYNEELTKAREVTKARMVTKNFEQFVAVPNNTGRLMLAAGQQKDWEGKVELYRRVAYDFSDSKSAPEAQFLLGYTYLVEARDRGAALRELTRLKQRWPKSRWVGKGQFLIDHLTEDPESFGPPETIPDGSGE